MARHYPLFWSMMATAVLVLYIISHKTENRASKIAQMLLWKEAVSINEREFTTSTSRGKFKNEGFSSLSYAEKQFKLYDGVEAFVMFIGYPGSGHSLVGTVLDAHPEIIIPHEYDVIKHWEKYQSSRLPRQKNMQKYQLFFDLHQFSKEQAVFGLRAPTYNFHIPGLWQGGYENKIKVIGDKKGGDTALAIRNLSRLHIFEEISQVAQAPIKFIHVIRNPFDNIATMMLRNLLIDPYVVAGKGIKIENKEELDASIDRYFIMAYYNQRVRELYGDSVLDIPGYETVLRPRETLQRLCDHLGVTCSEDYLERCSKILAGPRSKQLSFTRNTVVWTEEQKRLVTKMTKKILYLKEFSFDKYPS